MSQDSYDSFYRYEYRKLYGGRDSPSEAFFSSQLRKGQTIYADLQNSHALPKPLPDLFVCEVGCGAGGILQYFRERGCRVKGLDLDADYVKFGKTQHGLDLVAGTLADIPFPEPPDVVIYADVFEHILSPSEELAHVRRILSPNGLLYIAVPGVKHLLHTYGMDFLLFLQNAHVHHFSLSTLVNLLRANGFQIADGDESIKAVFKKSEFPAPTGEYDSDYTIVMKYLTSLEMLAESRRLLQAYLIQSRENASSKIE